MVTVKSRMNPVTLRIEDVVITKKTNKRNGSPVSKIRSQSIPGHFREAKSG
jgi:hypothetical protein